MKRSDITTIFPEATKEQIDQLMSLNGSDINASKGELETLQQKLSAAQAALAEKQQPEPDPSTKQQLAALQSELTAMKAAAAARELRDTVARATGIPAELLTGDTEDACKAQADAIRAYSESVSKPSYPALHDGGEVKNTGSGKTRDQFAAWFEQNMN